MDIQCTVHNHFFAFNRYIHDKAFHYQQQSWPRREVITCCTTRTARLLCDSLRLNLYSLQVPSLSLEFAENFAHSFFDRKKRPKIPYDPPTNTQVVPIYAQRFAKTRKERTPKKKTAQKTVINRSGNLAAKHDTDNLWTGIVRNSTDTSSTTTSDNTASLRCATVCWLVA